MKSILSFIQTTIVGGIFFLLPLIVLLVIIGKALQIAAKLIDPIADRIAVKFLAGIGISDLMAVMVVILFCFIAGIAARSIVVRHAVDSLEYRVLSHLPGYEFIKGMFANVTGYEQRKEVEVVLARIEESWQMGFLIEHIDDGHVAVFVPNSPSPWAGSVYFMEKNRIKPLSIPPSSALDCLRRMGLGSNGLLQGQLSWDEPHPGSRR